MLQQLLYYDTQLFLWLNSWHADWLDTPMYWISEAKTWIPFYLLLIVLIIRQSGKKAIGVVMMIALVIVLADGITSKGMKPYFQRPRPSHETAIQKEVHIVREYRGGAYGFASSHAANTFGLAMLLFLGYRRKWRYVGWMFVWAFLVSYSRIYLGVHYPLDIVCGAGVGMWTAYSVLALYQLIFRHNPMAIQSGGNKNSR